MRNAGKACSLLKPVREGTPAAQPAQARPAEGREKLPEASPPAARAEAGSPQLGVPRLPRTSQVRAAGGDGGDCAPAPLPRKRGFSSPSSVLTHPATHLEGKTLRGTFLRGEEGEKRRAGGGGGGKEPPSPYGPPPPPPFPPPAGRARPSRPRSWHGSARYGKLRLPRPLSATSRPPRANGGASRGGKGAAGGGSEGEGEGA